MKKSLLYYMQKNNIKIEANCGGLWACGKCKVSLDTSFPISDTENDLLTEAELNSGVRLACEQYLDENEAKIILAKLS